MYKEHPVFEKPENENVKIWRYLDFTKFVSLLDTKSLFFARADKLSDPFEGSYPEFNILLRPLVYQDLLKENFYKMQEQFKTFNKEIRNFTFINSWHMNEYESAAMWKLYLKTDEGVAIQSTFKRLTECFNEYEKDVFIGKVKYIDYKTEWLPEGNSFYPFLHKRKSFEYEHEIRAIIQIFPVKNNKLDLTQEISDSGIYVSVNLDKLIERVFISPTAQTWFIDLINSIAKKYNLEKEVVQSSLAERPVY